MPILGYFSKHDDRKLTMPRAAEDTPDARGAVLHGEVLTGKISVQDAFARETARIAQTLARGERAAGGNYDPVLKFHLGIE
jgi:hypothetical protein